MDAPTLFDQIDPISTDDVLAIRGDSRTMAYAEIFEGFPPELRCPIARLGDTLRGELGTSRADIDEPKAIARALAQAQAWTEARLEELAQAQQRNRSPVGSRDLYRHYDADLSPVSESS
jgi:hypothetical protein